MEQYPVIVALDGIERDQALELARKLAGRVWGFKVRKLYLTYGPSIVQNLKTFGKVFVDLKFHDIPSAVAENVRATLRSGADLVSIHSPEDEGITYKAMDREDKWKIAVVTDLTSDPRGDRVLGRAARARQAGFEHIICSPLEAKQVRTVAPHAKIITPGIREEGAKKHDQTRTLPARQALREGVDLLVIGRPIVGAPDPVRALEGFFKS